MELQPFIDFYSNHLTICILRTNQAHTTIPIHLLLMINDQLNLKKNHKYYLPQQQVEVFDLNRTTINIETSI